MTLTHYIIFSYVFMLGACLESYDRKGFWWCFMMFLMAPIAMPYNIGARVME